MQKPHLHGSVGGEQPCATPGQVRQTIEEHASGELLTDSSKCGLESV